MVTPGASDTLHAATIAARQAYLNKLSEERPGRFVEGVIIVGVKVAQEPRLLGSGVDGTRKTEVLGARARHAEHFALGGRQEAVGSVRHRPVARRTGVGIRHRRARRPLPVLL